MPSISLMPGSRSLPNQLTVEDRPIHRGGEGVIYATTDRKFAVKLYTHPAPDKVRLLQQVLELGRNLGEDERFLAWPLGVVNAHNSKPTVGVVTRMISPAHVPLYKLIYSPVDAVAQYKAGRSWLEYLKIARGTTAAVRAIHGKGMAHADIHLKNFLADLVSADVVLIDLDGLVVKGFLPPQVKGMPGFMAPEVVEGKAKPDIPTDRHSTAVLVLWILLLRNVMQTQKCYDEFDQAHDDELGYGQYACFSENPDDRRNWIPRIGTPLFRNGALSYRVLTPRLQSLTQQALINGLHNRPARPPVVEWEQALAEAYDVLVVCPSCRQSFFYPYWIDPPPRRQCPFCGAGVRAPYPVVVELLEAKAKGVHMPTRSVVFYHGSPLFADVIEPGRLPPFTRRGTPIVGQTVWDPKENAYRLVNNGDTPWQVITAGGTKVGRGQSVLLKKGLLLSFGDGKRLARVKE